MARIERQLTFAAQPITDVDRLAHDPQKWFESQPAVGKSAWFLAHADDGLIWGALRNGQLALSSDIVAVKLDPQTLIQAFLFGEQAEVRVWRDGDAFKACRCEDRPSQQPLAFDEEMILWGTKPEAESDSFTLLADGRQGLRHAIPMAIGKKDYKKRPVRLQARHYLAFEENHGQCRICASRLVGLKVSKEANND